MTTIFRTAMTRPDTALLQDALGALSLVVILVGGLHLPILF